MKPALATVCSLEAALPTILEDYAAGHCDAIDLWMGHAEAALEGRDASELRDLITSFGITPVAASFQGGLLTSQGEARQEHWNLFEKRLPLLHALGIPVLVLAGDAIMTQICPASRRRRQARRASAGRARTPRGWQQKGRQSP